jgi:Flp pilus assembly protein TadD
VTLAVFTPGVRLNSTPTFIDRRLPIAIAGLLLVTLLGACQRAPDSEPSSTAQPASSNSPAAPASGGSGLVVPAIVTYNEHVAPILFANCATCHRPIDPATVPAPVAADLPAAPVRRPVAGSARTAPAASTASGTVASPVVTERPASDPLCVAGAPFSVLDYRYVQPRAKAIAAAVRRRAMPPWLPEPGHGDFVNERRLADAQIAMIEAWAEGGAREGDPARRPPVPTFPSGWQLGTPDLVLQAEEAYTLPARGTDAFRNFVLRVPSAATRYVRAIEFRADNPRVLHHANVGVDPQRVSRLLDRQETGPGFASMPEDQVQDVFGWSPGKLPVMEPSDTAWTLEEGSDLVVQLHMVPSGAPEVVQPSIGLFFATTPPTRVPITVKLESKTIDIPAGDAAYVVEDSYVLPADVEAVSVYPHAHYLAKEMRGTATLPDGTVKPLLWIRNWSVRWQDQYRYRTPVFLPQGTTLRMRFTYDNSAANPNNRFRPPRRVQWGALSTDEMGALWLEVVPRRAEDAALLTRDYFARALRADIASAEMRVARSPGRAADMNALATKYLQAGRAGDAVVQLERALSIDPSDAEAHSNLGTALQVQGQLAEAMPHLGEAVRLKPADDRVRFNLGNGYYAAGKLDDAAREFRRAIQLNADNADAHFNLAMIVGPRNQLDEAVMHLRRVIELNPQNADAHRNLGLALSLQGRLDEAIARVNASLRIRPGAADATQLLDQLLRAKSARDGR